MIHGQGLRLGLSLLTTLKTALSTLGGGSNEVAGTVN